MKEMKRILSLVLCLVMLVGMMPMFVLNAEAAAGETTYVLAGSDFQASSHDAGATIVSGLLDKIKVDYPTMHGFLFGGDYDVNYNDSANGKAELQETVQAVYGAEMHEIYVQGNHDNDNLVGSTLTASGANDAENYGVFVINEKDYMWYNDNEATIKATADNLKTYLNGKRNAGYTKPIFVVSHLPLHYSMRTRSGGGDGKYANYIFDVLNEAGNAGLNIIFMFGHDHSHGWDDYLGGAAIFLTKGDKINIAQNSTTVFEEETLAFTYMNYGYVGYYGTSYTSDVDKTLTMTTFAITDDNVTISRYDSEGTHDLKSAGVYNVEYPDSAYYSTDTTTVGTPYTLTLNKEITTAGTEIEAPDSGNTGSGATQRTYTRVTSTSDLVSGGKYLIFYNGSHFMLPEVVEKSDGSVRKGFNIESTSICGPDTITGDYTAKEWVLTSSGSGWLLGNGTQYAKLTDTSDYKITATLENSGDVFTIGGSENAFTFSNGTYVFNYNDRGLINGYASNAATFYIYRMTNEGSSGSNVETSGGNWITITEPVAGGTKYVYELDTDGIDTDVEYLIVANSYAKAMSGTNGSAVDIDISGNYAYATSDTYGWTFTADGNNYRIRLNGQTYLGYNNAFISANSWPNSYSGQRTYYRWTISNNNNGSYVVTRGNYELRWSNSNGVFQASSSNEGPVRLYKYVKTETNEAQAGLYGAISGELTYNVANGTSEADALAAVMAGIDVYYTNTNTGAITSGTKLTDEEEKSLITWTFTEGYNGETGGEYPVEIAYNGVVLGTAKVVVPAVNITGYSVEPAYGTVSKGASQTAQTGALIYVQLENGKYYTVPVTVGMLTKADGSTVTTGQMGTIENLTLTYNGVKITENFTLNVTAKTGNNYPEYPNEGAVKVNKTGTGIDFQSTGIAQVEVSASGVPMKKGADVIVMLDLSSSMETNKVDGKTRLQILRESMTVLLGQLQGTDAEGDPLDIRIAVADFNRYYTDSDSPYYINSADHMTGGSIRTNISGTNKVYTGSQGINANAFVNVNDIDANAFETTTSSDQYYLGYQSGTNYDYAFEAIYQLGEAIITQNATDGVERDLFVIFMSDGAPFQFNYYSEQSDSNGAAAWNNWLQGTATEDQMAGNKTYYNEDGKHWMAEAIKGERGTPYPVIRKNNAADTDGDNWVEVNGLGAKMYSIGFCLAVDKQITVDSMDTVIRNIATSDQYYFRANSASDLNNTFGAIGADIAYAAYNARFVDQMGDDYNIQLKTETYTVVNDDKTTTEKTLAPVIEILSYDIYTRAEAEAGEIPEGKNIGDRKGTYKVLEVVKFSADGKKAYSNLIDADKDSVYGVTINADGTYTISDEDDNILGADGLIYATTFLYNTNSTGVAVEGVAIPTGKDENNLTTGTTNVLPAETFYWKMGTVQSSELAMRYYVYLTGSMEGTREAGSYPTNEYATLYYDNYLHNPCYKETVSPVMAWKEANVSYAFYLVDENGNIIVNQTTGETGTFANKIAVTNPVVYETVLLNSGEEVSSIDIASLGVLPEGYTLYDFDGTNGATYTVTINSNTTGAWVITSVKDKATTYVMQYDPNDASAYSNAKEEMTVGHDYTHTVVWFAVLWKVQALPDSVVIDYGLPVDISVLTNDMFGDNGKLAAVGPVANANLEGHDTALDANFGDSYTGTYGVATVNKETGKVRYTLNRSNGMQMSTYEKFAYAVNYTGNQNAGYYYDTVTVIPATTIYYEDSFVTLNDLTWQQTEGGEAWEGDWAEAATQNRWSQEGTTLNGLQDEDRPGKYSLTDANNIYGYDNVNKAMSTYSMGSAMKATVDYDNGAQAKFTFAGTGFDVISMTDSTTGTILVKVYDANDVEVKNFAVDTYYGYTQASCHVSFIWKDADKQVDKDGDGNATNDYEWVESKVLHTVAACDGSCELVTAYPENPALGAEACMVANAWVESASKDSIWQVPVIKVEGLEYGTYTVKIQAVYDPAFDHETTETPTTYDFYLDAIRIYDPANDGAADGTTDTTIEDAYVSDGEGWPTYFELRNKLIAADTLGNASTNTVVNGLVFIDGDASVGDADIADYIGFGPNNEVYLASGQSVAFILTDVKVDNKSIVAQVHIGVKSAMGDSCTYTVKNIAGKDYDKLSMGEIYNEKTLTVDTTTDMYYDLTGWRNDIIVITNTGSGIISLTNIKATYTVNPNGAAVANEEAGIAVASTDETVETASNEVGVYMTPAAATMTLRALNAPAVQEPEATEPEVTEPEVTEPEVTEPEVTEPETTVPEVTEPETTEPETTVPETEPEETEPSQEEQVKEVVEEIIKVIRKWFGKWFN